MNLTNLCKVITNAGLTRAIITIDTNNDESVVVLNIPTASVNSDTTSKNEQVMELRKAVAIPLRVMGKTGDVDQELDNLLSQYATGFVPAARALSMDLKSNSTTASKKQSKAATVATKNVKKSELAKLEVVTTEDTPSPVDAATPQEPILDNFDFFSDSASL
ncbi:MULTISPECIES: hypothetical protein [unclassified Pseudoalteromonas]|uniref:hypothetical protein n=1 Tax=unclassified Pseudoalteromonas TaxID=194690 RepID=UPI000405AE11|nr:MULTISPECIES: hypothetical protein [unclassified Pseudoalteromonas]